MTKPTFAARPVCRTFADIRESRGARRVEDGSSEETETHSHEVRSRDAHSLLPRPHSHFDTLNRSALLDGFSCLNRSRRGSKLTNKMFPGSKPRVGFEQRAPNYARLRTTLRSSAALMKFRVRASARVRFQMRSQMRLRYGNGHRVSVTSLEQQRDQVARARHSGPSAVILRP